MRHINGAYTTYFNSKRARSGHLFQGRYKAILADKDAYAKELSCYIHLNPVHAHMVKTPGHPWSSYNACIGETAAPDWLLRDFILAYFGKQTTRSQKKYCDFVMAMVDHDIDSPLSQAAASLVLGSAEFIQHVKERYLGNRVGSRDLPALTQIHSGIDTEAVMAIVAEGLAKHPKHIMNASIYLCRKHTGEQLRTIGQRSGISEAAVSQVCKRFKARIDNDQILKHEIENLGKKITL